jgi:hypothetical protein
MSLTSVKQLSTVSDNVGSVAQAAMEANGGLLRLAPNWVPRSFLQPGLRIKLDPKDTYAYGLERGGIDERWFGSTTECANEGRVHDEGLSYVVFGEQRFQLRDVVSELGGAIIGDDINDKYNKWPVFSKFFDNMGPIPHHMHQNAEQAALVGQEGKPESYYYPPQHNNVGNNFPYAFFGLNPGTTRQQVVDCIANWSKGDNGILGLSSAQKLIPGTGWLVPPCVLHAPGSLCTYEPQWGSDVFGMYQNLVEGREVPWSLLVKDMPEAHHQDVDFIVDQLDWEGNVDPNFKDNHFLEPIADTQDDAHVDKWIVYGTVKDVQYFSAKELTVYPGGKVTIQDNGASSIIVTQGQGKINDMPLDCPKMIGFHELTQDEVFITATAAKNGVTFENTSPSEPLVILRYFGPGVNPQAPAIGDYKK